MNGLFNYFPLIHGHNNKYSFAVLTFSSKEFIHGS